MRIDYTRLIRPFELHGVPTPGAYLKLLDVELQRMRMQMPSPHVVLPKPHHAAAGEVQVRQGRWVVECACAPDACASYDPEWGLAVCLACAAIYVVAPPADWREVEACLMRRPLLHRNMWHGETLRDLRVENERHALGEGA